MPNEQEAPKAAEPETRATGRRRSDATPGVVAALLLLCLYAGWGVSVDFPRAAFGFQSDEATYYLMTHSIVSDHDLKYRREDLVRTYREFPSGPNGIFLKRGSAAGVVFDGRVPFVHLSSTPIPDTTELFYGKNYAYPAFAAPFVAVFRTNGFLVFHALLLASMLLAGYLFLNARMSTLPALVLSTGFLMASVAPAYFVWMTPELFNLALVVLGYFCWLYKEVADPASAPKWLRWAFKPGSDLAAIVLLAIATFSKPTCLLLVLPMLAMMAMRRQWKRGLIAGVLYGLTGAVLLAGNIAISGEWNYQGGDRRTFYGDYPFQNASMEFSAGKDKVTDKIHEGIIFDKRVFWTLLSHNLAYFFIGRYAGILPYYFPAVFAMGLFLWQWRRRPKWEWLVFGAVMAEILLLIVWVPYTYNGGGGSVGNRYFMSTYGVLLFLLPATESALVAVVPWLIGAIFTAQITLNPFFAAYYPGEPAKQGPLRLLPVELTLVFDIPINTEPDHPRIWFGQNRRFQIYFLDDDAYKREGLFFWMRGQSRAEFFVKSAEPASFLELTLATAASPTRVKVSRGWWSETVDMQRDQTTKIRVPLDAGFPFQGTRVWLVSISTTGAFVPRLEVPGSDDRRFLAVQVTPELIP